MKIMKYYSDLIVLVSGNHGVKVVTNFCGFDPI